jgi:hypothetical protein
MTAVEGFADKPKASVIWFVSDYVNCRRRSRSKHKPQYLVDVIWCWTCVYFCDSQSAKTINLTDLYTRAILVIEFMGIFTTKYPNGYNVRGAPTNRYDHVDADRMQLERTLCYLQDIYSDELQ